MKIQRGWQFDNFFLLFKQNCCIVFFQIEVDDSSLTPDSDTVNRAFEKSKVTYTINGTDVVFEPNKPFSVTDRELSAEMLSTEIKRKAAEV